MESMWPGGGGGLAVLGKEGLHAGRSVNPFPGPGRTLDGGLFLGGEKAGEACGPSPG